MRVSLDALVARSSAVLQSFLREVPERFPEGILERVLTRLPGRDCRALLGGFFKGFLTGSLQSVLRGSKSGLPLRLLSRTTFSPGIPDVLSRRSHWALRFGRSPIWIMIAYVDCTEHKIKTLRVLFVFVSAWRTVHMVASRTLRAFRRAQAMQAPLPTTSGYASKICRDSPRDLYCCM